MPEDRSARGPEVGRLRNRHGLGEVAAVVQAQRAGRRVHDAGEAAAKGGSVPEHALEPIRIVSNRLNWLSAFRERSADVRDALCRVVASAERPDDGQELRRLALDPGRWVRSAVHPEGCEDTMPDVAREQDDLRSRRPRRAQPDPCLARLVAVEARVDKESLGI
jgi:hypothetical protein